MILRKIFLDVIMNSFSLALPSNSNIIPSTFTSILLSFVTSSNRLYLSCYSLIINSVFSSFKYKQFTLFALVCVSSLIRKNGGNHIQNHESACSTKIKFFLFRHIFFHLLSSTSNHDFGNRSSNPIRCVQKTKPLSEHSVILQYDWFLSLIFCLDLNAWIYKPIVIKNHWVLTGGCRVAPCKSVVSNASSNSRTYGF